MSQQDQAMATTKSVSAELVAAYLRTEFRVADRGWSFVLRHDEYSKVLEECHRAFGVSCSAYITAWNPRSEPTSREVNEAAQARFEVELQAAGLEFLRGVGVDPTSTWPGEPSLLVLGISGGDAQRLGVAYRQNAIVLAGRDAVPRVVMLKE
jgi:hypothetical protein